MDLEIILNLLDNYFVFINILIVDYPNYYMNTGSLCNNATIFLDCGFSLKAAMVSHHIFHLSHLWWDKHRSSKGPGSSVESVVQRSNWESVGLWGIGGGGMRSGKVLNFL